MGRSLCPACNETWTHTAYTYYPICKVCVDKLDPKTLAGAATLAYLEAYADESMDSSREEIMELLAPHVPIDGVLKKWRIV